MFLYPFESVQKLQWQDKPCKVVSIHHINANSLTEKDTNITSQWATKYLSELFAHKALHFLLPHYTHRATPANI